MLRTMLLAACLLLAAAARAQCPPPPPAPAAAATPVDRGLLWSVTKDGRRSWLYGTLHLGRPDWVVPGPKTAAALRASDVLALELDPADPQVQRELAQALAAPAPALPAGLKQRLARQAERACIDGALFASLHPGVQVTLLAMAEARHLGLDAAYGSEQALVAWAQGAKRPVVSMESVALQARLILPADAEDLKVLAEQTLDPLEAGQGRAVLSRLVQAWERGDDAAIADYERWCACVKTDADRAALRALNDERNPALADRIAALHREGRRVFAAVGALHMTGPQGLPRLLAARGFAVERVAFGVP